MVNGVGKIFLGFSRRSWGECRKGKRTGEISSHLTMMLQSAGYHEQNARAADLRWSIVTGAY